MKKILTFIGSIFIILGAIQLSFAGESKISVTAAWARPVIIQNRPGGAYFIIKNEGNITDKMIKATSSFAERIELHVHKHDNGMMKMMQVENIPVAAHATTAVEPGGYHLMLFGLSKKLAVGDELPLTLTFAHAGEIKITARVMKKAP